MEIDAPHRFPLIFAGFCDRANSRLSDVPLDFLRLCDQHKAARARHRPVGTFIVGGIMNMLRSLRRLGWRLLISLPIPALIAATSPASFADSSVRVGMIPDAGATQVSIDEKAPLREYLERVIGTRVELMIPTNYNATVEALGNGSLDFAYLGGLTYVKARALYNVIPLVQRESDRQFHSLFITAANSPIKTLADLRGKTFVFGDINSTSGHLMPYAALKQSGIDPGTDFSFRYTGSHPATAKAVEARTADAGALDESVYQTMLAQGQLDSGKVRVFYTTPPFIDYVWVARDGIGDYAREKFARAFLALGIERDGKVLSILRGTSFRRVSDGEYDSLRQIARELKLF
jgi:phosphonate transport system substrate-binding protein